MNVSCPQCSTIYRVDPAKVPQGGVRARCSTCGGVIPVGIISSGQHRAVAADPIGDAFASRPSSPRPFMAGPATPPASPRVATPPAPQRAATPAAAAPRVPTPHAPAARMPTPPARPAMRTPPSSPALGATLPGLRATPAVPQAPVAPSPALTPSAPISIPAETPPSASPPAAAAPPSPGSQPAGRRPINPFLARDPSLRAKRLARALVSDMVAYYPAKHAEGLEKGTLKELFRDEIKKSYEEYVAQVGADFARTTTHFQESLNEVLGAGKKIF